MKDLNYTIKERNVFCGSQNSAAGLESQLMRRLLSLLSINHCVSVSCGGCGFWVCFNFSSAPVSSTESDTKDLLDNVSVKIKQVKQYVLRA